MIPLIKEANSITINPIDNDNATINLKNKYFELKNCLKKIYSNLIY